MKRILTLLAFVALAITANAVIQSGSCGGNVTFVLNDDGTLVISGSGDMMNYTYSYAPWYNNRSKIINVQIEDGVTSIGNGAFGHCSGLNSVTIPNSVTSIGQSAFYGCSGLTSITVPNSVTNIGGSAFDECYRLQKIFLTSSVPPTCDSGVFKCSTSYVRDAYDVYSYATLHVPMGSKEDYSSAHEWRYFNKIKEDMEMDGTTYYANLTVKQGTTGYTQQAVKADETYTLYIGSLGGNKVNAVTFNGKDVTDEVFNGYYTTPEIKGESVLTISYETTADEIKSPSLNDVRVTGYDGAINISNIDESSNVQIYNVEGKLVESKTSVYGDATIEVPIDQVYIVKIGNRTYKIAI